MPLVIEVIRDKLWGETVPPSNPKGPRVFLNGIRDNLYNLPTGIDIIFCVIYGIESIFSTTHQKEEMNLKSYVITVIRYMWYVFESGTLTRTQMPLIIHCTHMYAPTGIVHIMNGLL